MPQELKVAPSAGHAVLLTQFDDTGAAPTYDAIDLRRMLAGSATAKEGVIDPAGWKVNEASPNAMQVVVDANVGLARVDGDSLSNQGPYIVAPHATTMALDAPPADPSAPRVDSVWLRVWDDTADGLSLNEARVVYAEGTPTGGATASNRLGAPVLPATALLLADVVVPAGATAISQANITDRRVTAAPPAHGSTHTSGGGDATVESGSVVITTGGTGAGSASVAHGAPWTPRREMVCFDTDPGGNPRLWVTSNATNVTINIAGAAASTPITVGWMVFR